MRKGGGSKSISGAHGHRRRTVKEYGPDPADVHVGWRIRQARMMLNLSQTTLAQSINISFQAVQKYERGGIRVSASRLVQLSRLLGKPLAYFFEGLEVPEPMEGALAELIAAERDLLGAFRALQDDELRRAILRLLRSMARTMGTD